MENTDKKKLLIANVAALTVIVVVLTVLAINGTGAVIEVAGNNAVYRGSSDKNGVTLMFNVYWGEEYIPEILDLLDAYNVKTTFFIGGSWAAKNMELVREISDRGHEIGSHGYNHKDAEKLSYDRNMDEMVPAQRLLEQLTGKEVRLFAPPSGSIGQEMFNAAEDLGYTVVMWSRDTVDWRDKNADLVYKRATSDTQSGELILMHPTEHTLKALEKILQYYQNSDLKPMTVGENIFG